ncbi:MAG: hypothetical protein KDN20_21710 [Verrucomicrobiae bacterium]|nr:hypothetical protein [Verrucomicrobiae bacterium]
MNTIPTLQSLVEVLTENQDTDLRVTLPDHTQVPAHFHVTEVGRVQKDFIDCGGTVRSSVHCQLQLLVASDIDHRLKAGKLLKILSLSEKILGDRELPLVIEHEDGRTIAFPVVAISVGDDTVDLKLDLPHPACLAADKCGLSFEEAGTGNLIFRPASATSGCCSTETGCC